ncbi:MAG: hypothetical protein AAGJ82_09960 [Bacteroidota bacterium]
MTNRCLLFCCLLFGLLATEVLAQQRLPRGTYQLSLSYTPAVLPSNSQDTIYRPGGSYITNYNYTRRQANGISTQLAYQYPLSRRWDAGLRLNFTVHRATDTLELLRQYTSRTDLFTHPRRYHALWVEGMFFWKFAVGRHLIDHQIGLGISYNYYRHRYLSGYVFNQLLDQFETMYIRREQRVAFGIPVAWQFGQEIHPQWRVGFHLNMNYLFNDSLLFQLGGQISYTIE